METTMDCPECGNEMSRSGFCPACNSSMDYSNLSEPSGVEQADLAAAQPTPMFDGVPLGPLSTMRVAFGYVIRKFDQLILLALIPTCIELPVSMGLGSIAGGLNQIHGQERQVIEMVAALVSFPFGLAALAGTFFILDTRWQRGTTRFGFLFALRKGFGLFSVYFGAYFTLSLSMIPALLPGIVLAVLEIWPLAIGVFVAGGLVDMYFLVRWSLAFVLIVEEGIGFSEAFSRSSGMVDGRWWKVFAAYSPFLLSVAGGLFVSSLGIRALCTRIGFSAVGTDFVVNSWWNILLSPLLCAIGLAVYSGLKTIDGCAPTEEPASAQPRRLEQEV